MQKVTTNYGEFNLLGYQDLDNDAKPQSQKPNRGYAITTSPLDNHLPEAQSIPIQEITNWNELENVKNFNIELIDELTTNFFKVSQKIFEESKLTV